MHPFLSKNGTPLFVYDSVFVESALGYTPVWLTAGDICGGICNWNIVSDTMLGRTEMELLYELRNLYTPSDGVNPRWIKSPNPIRDKATACSTHMGFHESLRWLSDGILRAATIEDILAVNRDMPGVDFYVFTQKPVIFKRIETSEDLDTCILDYRRYKANGGKGTAGIQFRTKDYGTTSMRYMLIRQPADLLGKFNGSDTDKYHIRRDNRNLDYLVSCDPKSHAVWRSYVGSAAILSKKEALELLSVIPDFQPPSKLRFAKIEKVEPNKKLWMVEVTAYDRAYYLCYPTTRSAGRNIANARLSSDVSGAYHYPTEASAKKAMDAVYAEEKKIHGFQKARVVTDDDYIKKLKENGVL